MTVLLFRDWPSVPEPVDLPNDFYAALRTVNKLLQDGAYAVQVDFGQERILFTRRPVGEMKDGRLVSHAHWIPSWLTPAPVESRPFHEIPLQAGG